MYVWDSLLADKRKLPSLDGVLWFLRKKRTLEILRNGWWTHERIVNAFRSFS